MTPGARLAAAHELLVEIASSGTAADKAIYRYFRGRRYAGGGDRKAVRARVYGLLRRLAALQWHLRDADGDAELPRQWVIADLALQGDDPVAVMTGQGYDLAAPDDGEAALVGRLAGRDLVTPAMAWTTRTNLPDWLGPYFERRFGDGAEAEAEALNSEAPLDVRVNGLRGSRDDAMALLADEGIAAEAIAGTDWGLRLAGRVNLMASKAFREGWLEPQDAGSQALAAAVDAASGQTVVDLCAGAGGKTLALAAAMGKKGRLIAADQSPARLARMAPRLARAGVGWVETGGDDLAVAADRVLVDAPCSGTGTWRRKVFARWQLDAAQLARRLDAQRALLRRGAELVKPGGRLIYATCSMLAEENGDQVDAFLADDERFARVGDDLAMTPARDGTDGVYAAVLVRQ